jgi:hypothetical protein
MLLDVFVIAAMSQGDMKDTFKSLRVMIVREGRELACREDASKLRAVVLNMPLVDFHTLDDVKTGVHSSHSNFVKNYDYSSIPASQSHWYSRSSHFSVVGFLSFCQYSGYSIRILLFCRSNLRADRIFIQVIR